MGITDSQKQKIEDLDKQLNNIFSDYQEKCYQLVYSSDMENEEMLEKELNENYKKFLKESKIIEDTAFNLFKSIVREEDKDELKQLYDKIYKQNGDR